MLRFEAFTEYQLCLDRDRIHGKHAGSFLYSLPHFLYIDCHIQFPTMSYDIVMDLD